MLNLGGMDGACATSHCATKAQGQGWKRVAERRLRTAQRKKRARAKFWDEYGERIRLGLIAGGMVAAASLVAKVALG